MCQEKKYEYRSDQTDSLQHQQEQNFLPVCSLVTNYAEWKSRMTIRTDEKNMKKTQKQNNEMKPITQKNWKKKMANKFSRENMSPLL